MCHKNEENETYGISIHGRKKTRLLHCTQEEVHDRIQFYINLGVKVDGTETVLACSGDTDMYVSLLYNYEYYWRYYGLQKI